MSECQSENFPEFPLICEEALIDSPLPLNPKIWVPEYSNYFQNLQKDQDLYTPDLYAFTRQKEITMSMRSILLDWLLELTSEFFLKRETYYLAASHIDRLISSITISRAEFQLIGISALYLACKSEEINPPKICDFIKAGSRLYPARSIIAMEKKILCRLEWRIYPTTLYAMLNVLLLEWDSYILVLFGDYVEYVGGLSKDKLKQQDLLNKRLETFKVENTYSYKRFREAMQVLDACTLDYSVFAYQNTKLIGAILYLMVNRCFFQDKYELLWWNSLVLGCSNTISEEETVLLGTETIHIILENFLCTILNIVSIDALTAPIQHLNKYLSFPFCYNLPPVSRTARNIQENYESFLSFQTHNNSNLKFLATHNEKGT